MFSSRIKSAAVLLAKGPSPLSLKVIALGLSGGGSVSFLRDFPSPIIPPSFLYSVELLDPFLEKKKSNRAPPSISPRTPPANPPMIPPTTGTTLPTTPPTPPRIPAPIALNAALPGCSPSIQLKPKSMSAPMIGSLNLLVNLLSPFKNNVFLDGGAFAIASRRSSSPVLIFLIILLFLGSNPSASAIC